MKNATSETNERTCPYCAEALPADAPRCPHCQSVPGDATPADGSAHRNRPGRQIAGVSVALAAATGISVTLIRLAFILLTFATGVAPVVYVVLWLVLPNDPGEPSLLARLTRTVTDEPPGAPAPLTRFLDWLRPKLSAAERWLRGVGRSTEGSS